MSPHLDFDSIRAIDGSQRDGFEELCSQIAHSFEDVPDSWSYTRLGDPDAGIECKWEAPSGEVWGWQAKYVDNIDNSSLSQIDGSIKRALDNYPGLSRYFICVPCDRPHGARDGVKTALEKWEDREEKWERWADERDMDVEFIFWGQSELIEFLSEDQHKGRLYFWFDTEGLTGSKLEEELDVTISNAKDRYSPELHVETGNADIFEPFGRTPTFVGDVEDHLDELHEKAERLFTGDNIDVLTEAGEEDSRKLRQAVERIPTLLGNIEKIPEEIPIHELQRTCNDANDAIRELETGLHSLKEDAEEEKDAVETTEKATLRDFRQLRSAVIDIQRFVNGNDLQAANKSALKLLGDAGMGKTHLLCNVAKTRTDAGYPTIMVLGENLREGDIWTQIINRLGLDCTTDELLGALDSFGESRGIRSLIMIDALNESPDPRMWNSRLPGLISKIENYPHVGLCVSCRTGYEDLVIPDSIEEDIVESVHYGFNNVEYEAVRKFFDAHGIEHSSIPVLKREFQVPLFLKLFCENLESRGQTRVSHGPEGISEIFEGYIDGVHDRLHPRLDYDPSDNKVRKAVEALAREMAERGGGTKHLPKTDAKDIVDDFLPGRSYSKSLYRHILSEGVISEVVNPISEDIDEAVRFSYDKFADHMLAQQYLELYVDGDFGEALSDTDELKEIFEDPGRYPGLIQAFAIHLPESEGVEIFEYINPDEILKPFIKSLGWRAPGTLTDADGELRGDIGDYLWDEIETLDELHELWRVLLTLSTSSDHPLNAEYLHTVLWEHDLVGRDHNWSKFLHEEFHEDTSEVFRLVNWGFSLENKPLDSLELKRLMSTTLVWFLSCPNRYVRDRSTKAIVNIVGSDLELYTGLIERFQDVNDPYVLERVYAAAYGGVLRHRDQDAVTEIADLIYELEFEDNDPVPHILTRDYARGIIELANHRVDSYTVDLEKARPPYDSSFSIEVPSPEELAEQVRESLEESDTDLESRFWIGLVGSSFEGDGFSDFARYVVGTNHDSTHVHGYDFSGPEALRWITKRVFDLGWNPDDFGDFDHYLNRWTNQGRGTRKPEKFSKKYQWIAYYELVSWITDNCEFTDPITEDFYNGPWVTWDRDIDPSVLDPDVGPTISLDDVPDYDCRIDETPIEEWISDHEEFPDLRPLLELSVDRETWYPLHGIYKWKAEEDTDSRLERDVFCRIDSVIVDEEDQEELVDWITENWIRSDEIRSKLITLPTVTQVFRGEYPWHPIVGDRWEESATAVRGCPVDSKNTSLDLLWEAEYDCSIGEKYSMYVPSPAVTDLLGLERVIDSKEFLQPSGAVRVADVSKSGGLYDRADSTSILSANSAFVDVLEDQGYSIVWVVQGEKRAITSGMAGNKMGQTQTRAVFTLDEEGEIVGTSESDFYDWE